MVVTTFFYLNLLYLKLNATLNINIMRFITLFFTFFLFNLSLPFAKAQNLPKIELNDAWINEIKALAPAKKHFPSAKTHKVLVFSLFTGFDHWVIPHTEAMLKTITEKVGGFEMTYTRDIKYFDKNWLQQFDAIILNNNCSIGDKRNLFWDVFKNDPTLDSVQAMQKAAKFEKYLLLIAQREINEKSDIHFEFERIKPSRKIEGIKFIISKNKSYELRNNPSKQVQEVKRKPAVIHTLKEFGLSTRVINQLLKENTEQVIQDAINAVDLQLSRGHVRNSKAMLMTAIKEQWHPEKYKQR